MPTPSAGRQHAEHDEVASSSSAPPQARQAAKPTRADGQDRHGEVRDAVDGGAWRGRAIGAGGWEAGLERRSLRLHARREAALISASKPERHKGRDNRSPCWLPGHARARRPEPPRRLALPPSGPADVPSVRHERRQRARARDLLAAAGSGQPQPSRATASRTGPVWAGSTLDRGSPHVSKQPIAAYDDARFRPLRAREASRAHLRRPIRFASTGERSSPTPTRSPARPPVRSQRRGRGPADARARTSARQRRRGRRDRLRAPVRADHARERRGDGDVAAGIEAACTGLPRTCPLYAINLS